MEIKMRKLQFSVKVKLIYLLVIGVLFFIHPSRVFSVYSTPGIYVSADGKLGNNSWYVQAPSYSDIWQCPFDDRLTGFGGSMPEGNHKLTFYSYVYHSPPGQGLGACSSRTISDDGTTISSGTEDHGYPQSAAVAPSDLSQWHKDGDTPYVKVDSHGPIINIISPNKLAVFYTNSVAVSGNASDTLSGLKNVTVNGNPATTDNGNWQYTVSGLVNGANTITVMAYDNAGNASTNTIDVLYVPISATSIPNTQAPSQNNPSQPTTSPISNIPTATSTLKVINKKPINENFLKVSITVSSSSTGTPSALPKLSIVEKITKWVNQFFSNIFNPIKYLFQIYSKKNK